MRKETSNRNRDLRLYVLLIIGAVILAAGRYAPEPDLRKDDFYLSPAAGSNSPDVLRIIGSGTAEDDRSDLLRITPDLPCTETPPELALFFNLPLPVNRADPDTLTLLPGIGPKLAERIIAFREGKGEINGPEDFMRIKGIGPKLTERLTPLLCFSGTEAEQ